MDTQRSDQLKLDVSHLPNEFKIYEIKNLIYGFLNRKFSGQRQSWCIIMIDAYS